jgi:SAM-dependent methyltransferase
MQEETTQRLLSLNREFYQQYAAPFAESRQRLQPGVLRALAGLPSECALLDLGCGSGAFAQELARRGHRGAYLGLDRSAPLLRSAQAESLPANMGFDTLDLAASDWAARLCGPFDRIFAFALLHHLPGADGRLRFLRQVRGLVADDGRFVLSNWDFMASPRMRKRITPWETVGLTAQAVDPGDHLLDWRRGGLGYRYVHHFTESELAELAAEAGFDVDETYRADGENGRLGLYQVWRPRVL